MKGTFTMPSVLRLMRISQYTKNIFVFFPLFFSANLFNLSLLTNSCIMFISFCFVASSIYILNDIRDVEEDRNHPTKCMRPIASGEVRPRVAVLFSACLFIISFTIAYSLSIPCAMVILTYFSLNIFYVYFAKNYAIIDIACISIGFVLRTIAGSFAIDHSLSHWLTLMVFLLCMFLALGKRWDDMCLEKNEQTTGKIRDSIKSYSRPFILASMTFLSTINTVCYILYTIIPSNTYYALPELLYTTSLWVILGNMRYLQIAFVDEKSASPTRIFLYDRGIQSCVCLWTIHLIVLLYV
ncbi:MAG: UbiA prenyltransferase family protein [Pseudomonadota bacterium]